MYYIQIEQYILCYLKKVKNTHLITSEQILYFSEDT